MSKARSTKGNAPTVAAVEASGVPESTHSKGEIHMVNTSTMPAVYNFGDKPVRVLQRDGEPWFVAADVCTALGLGNPTKALRSLDAEEQALTSIQGLSRGNSQANVISESGLYTLILRCRDAVKPGTVPHRFRRWVTGELIPNARKAWEKTAPRPYNPAIDYDRISPAQAQDLKDIVHAIVSAGVQGYGETWNRLHNKFKVNSYLELPATRHLEAREYLIAKLPKGYTPEVVDPEPEPVPKLQLAQICTRLDRLACLFHPFSQQSADVLGIRRLLQGRCPTTGLQEKGFVPLLAA